MAVHMSAFVQKLKTHLIVFSLFPRWLQRRALRTASEKLRNRSSFSTNVVYTTPGTRVNRYISRLLEARQTDLEMADLNFFTLKYKHVEREQKVSDLGTSSLSPRLCWSSDGQINVWFSLFLSVPILRSLNPLFPPSSTVPPASR